MKRDPTPPAPNRVPSWIHLTVTVGLAIALFLQGRRLSQLEASRPTSPEAPSEPTTEETEPAPAVTSNRPDPVTPVSIHPADPGRSVEARLANLLRRVDQLADQIPESGRGPNVPEWDPSNPTEDISIPDLPEVGATEFVSGWSALQVIGAPDTRIAADVSTAWASGTPDGGVEWLRTGFRKSVEIDEVRVRESFNPGAISRITATVDGVEIDLWEGTAARSRGMRDFVVRPARGIVANQITVHLDTSRVPGWNEIDAVELVGFDGTRQWATSAQASSEFGRRVESRAFRNGTDGGTLNLRSVGQPR